MRKTLSAAVLFGLTLAAGPAGSASPVKWTAGPSGGDIAEALQGKPAADGTPGRVQLNCQIARTGELTACKVASEEPTGMGLGEAALAMATKFHAAPAPDLPPEVVLPLRFEASPPIRPPVFKPTDARFRYLSPIGAYFPERAERLDVGGYAIAECHLAAPGVLSMCSVLEERPAGWGFAEATLAMAKSGYLTAEPRTVDGQPVADEVVRVLVKFPQPRQRK